MDISLKYFWGSEYIATIRKVGKRIVNRNGWAKELQVAQTINIMEIYLINIFINEVLKVNR